MADSPLNITPLSEDDKETSEEPKTSTEQLSEPLNPDSGSKPKTRIITKTIRDTWWRFLFLGICCLVLLGSYYCYDNPAPVQKMINAPIKQGTQRGVEHGMNMSDFQYQLLYSFYSFPNIILPLFGGFFIDYIGKRNGVILFSAIVAMGQFFFAISTHIIQSNETLGKYAAFLGRLVFGLGGENLAVTESSFIATWFAGKELSFAMGTDLCISRIFAVINDATQPAFYTVSGHKLSLGFWFGFILCLISIGFAIVLVMIDASSEQVQAQIEVPAYEAEEPEVFEAQGDSKVKISDLKELPRTFFILAGSCVLSYMSFMSFMNVASGMLEEHFGFSLETAGYIMGVPYIVAAVVSPFLGFLLDLYGLKTIVLIVSPLIFALAHLYFALLPQYWSESGPGNVSIFGFVILGFAYSFYTSSIWPCVPYVVDRKMLGRAFGILIALENIGLTVGPMLVGIMLNTKYKKGYFAVSLLNFFEALGGAACAGYLFYCDINSNSVLLASSRVAEKIQKEERQRQKALAKS